MKICLRLLSVSFSVLALSGVVRPAHAQECVGLPGGRGILSVGLEGTDGATGSGVAFAYQTPRASVQLQHRALDDFTVVDDLRTTDVQASVGLPGVRLPVCVTAGVQRTAYDDTRHESTEWTGQEPGRLIERHRIGGPYRRQRVPVGVSMGREFRVGSRVSLVPFIAPAVVFERETYRPETGPAQTRSAWGLGASGGVAASLDWFVLRASLSHTATHEYALSSKHNHPTIALHAGVRF